MVAYLKKPSGSEGFQEIVDFLNGSHIRYALTKNPTIYVSLIKKFWQTATVRTVDNKEQEITATVDGKEFIITEASVRRHLQLADVDGISVLPTTKIFDQLSLMGQALNQVTELPQTSEPIPNVPDEAVYEEWDDIVERATTTAASLDAEQASGNINRTQSTTIPNVPLPQGIGAGGSPRCQEAIGGSIAQTRSKRVTTSPCDSPLPRVHTLRSDEGTKVLADAAKTNIHTYTRRRRVVSTGSGRISTVDESVSTVGASMQVSTAGMVQEVNISIPSPVVVKDKEWEKIKARVEVNEELSKRLQAEERNKYSEVDQAKMLVDLINQRKKYFAAQKAEAKRNKPMTQAQHRNYMINYIKHMGSHTLQQLKIYSFDKLKELFETTMKNVNTFVPMKTEDKGRALELVTGSSQATIIDFAEIGSSKRAAEAELDHEGSKR
ncbi:hypothetical protein Tco_1323480 [Tanacetum coccineum]